MNPEPSLESLVDRELKSLPPLAAPDSLLPRVLAALAARAALPWYRRAWQTWPRGGQIVSLAALAAACAAFGLAGGQLSNSDLLRPTAGAFGLVVVVANLVATLAEALLLTLKHLNPTWLAAALLVLATGWFSCVGLGTALFRLAAVRR
jgi:hypothetical protein